MNVDKREDDDKCEGLVTMGSRRRNKDTRGVRGARDLFLRMSSSRHVNDMHAR